MINGLREHIERLAAQHEIIITITPFAARAFRKRFGEREADEIEIPPITTPIRYAVALHEIGHILGRYQDHHNEVVSERWAWEWARRNAIWWTSKMDRFAERALRGYQRHRDRSPIIWKVRPSELARSRGRAPAGGRVQGRAT
jgi:hypothetical protein